jgi:mRNA interferase HigB
MCASIYLVSFSHFGNFEMRIVKIKTLENFWKKYPETEQSLRAWYAEAKTAQWLTPHQIKQQYRSASILNDKRVVFNIKGNSFRLIVDVEYELGRTFAKAKKVSKLS